MAFVYCEDARKHVLNCLHVVVQGKPEAENGRSCRCECPVLIRLLRASDNKLYITEYSENHNRSLSLTMVEKAFKKKDNGREGSLAVTQHT